MGLTRKHKRSLDLATGRDRVRVKLFELILSPKLQRLSVASQHINKLQVQERHDNFEFFEAQEFGLKTCTGTQSRIKGP